MLRRSAPRVSKTYCSRSNRNVARSLRALGELRRILAGVAGQRAVDQRVERRAHARTGERFGVERECAGCRARPAAARRDRAIRSAARPRGTTRRACRACRRATATPTSTAAGPSAAAVGAAFASTADRQVVVVDRLPHGFRLAGLARVDAAHRALELGELAHHVGREIGFRQPRGPRRRVRLGRPLERRRSQSTRASFSMRAAFAAYEPSALWNSTVSRRASRASRPTDRSASQKNRASRRRAVTTRSAFVAIARSLVACVFVTARNAGISDAVRAHHREEMLMVNQRRRQHFRGQRRGTPRRTRRRRPPGTRRDRALPRAAPRLRVAAGASRGRRAGARALRDRAGCDRADRCARAARSSRSASCGTRRSVRTLIARPARPVVARKRWP